MPPRTASSAAAVLEDFADQISHVFGMPRPAADSWNDLLWHVANQVKEGRAILILDEVNWLARHDPEFATRIWRFWETKLSVLDDFILILSGALAGWVDG